MTIFTTSVAVENMPSGDRSRGSGDSDPSEGAATSAAGAGLALS